MKKLGPNEPFNINLLSLSCHQTVSGKAMDNIVIKCNDKRIYPHSGSKLLDIKKGETHRFKEMTLNFQGGIDLDTVVLELWYKKNLFQYALGGRFFFMLNISEVGFSATQLIRSSAQEKSHYLIHWEMRGLESGDTDEQEESTSSTYATKKNLF